MLIYNNGRSSFDVTALTPCDVYAIKVIILKIIGGNLKS